MYSDAGLLRLYLDQVQPKEKLLKSVDVTSLARTAKPTESMAKRLVESTDFGYMTTRLQLQKEILEATDYGALLLDESTMQAVARTSLTVDENMRRLAANTDFSPLAQHIASIPMFSVESKTIPTPPGQSDLHLPTNIQANRPQRPTSSSTVREEVPSPAKGNTQPADQTGRLRNSLSLYLTYFDLSPTTI